MSAQDSDFDLLNWQVQGLPAGMVAEPMSVAGSTRLALRWTPGNFAAQDSNLRSLLSQRDQHRAQQRLQRQRQPSLHRTRAAGRQPADPDRVGRLIVSVGQRARLDWRQVHRLQRQARFGGAGAWGDLTAAAWRRSCQNVTSSRPPVGSAGNSRAM